MKIIRNSLARACIGPACLAGRGWGCHPWAMTVCTKAAMDAATPSRTCARIGRAPRRGARASDAHHRTTRLHRIAPKMHEEVFSAARRRCERPYLQGKLLCPVTGERDQICSASGRVTDWLSERAACAAREGYGCRKWPSDVTSDADVFPANRCRSGGRRQRVEAAGSRDRAGAFLVRHDVSLMNWVVEQGLEGDEDIPGNIMRVC